MNPFQNPFLKITFSLEIMKKTSRPNILSLQLFLVCVSEFWIKNLYRVMSQHFGKK